MKKSSPQAKRKVAIITGAAQGIGQRTAEVLAAQGYDLLLSDLRIPEETASKARSAGVEAIHVLGDVSREEVAAEIAKAALSKFGGVDVLVNNAGISLIERAENTTVAQWRQVQAVPGVAVAAPLATVGYVMQEGTVPLVHGFTSEAV